MLGSSHPVLGPSLAIVVVVVLARVPSNLEPAGMQISREVNYVHQERETIYHPFLLIDLTLATIALNPILNRRLHRSRLTLFRFNPGRS